MNRFTHNQHALRPFIWLLICTMLTTGCQDETQSTPAVVKADAVLAWNQGATVAVTRMTNPATGFFIFPHIEARIYAMLNLAMYDALNNIQKKNTPCRVRW